MPAPTGDPVSIAPPRRPSGWPYWSPVGVATIPEDRQPLTFPVAHGTIRRSRGAEVRWQEAGPAVRDQLEATGIARLQERPARYGIGAYYESQICDDVPVVITVDALAALSFLVVEAALADADLRLAQAMRTLLDRLDARLSAAEPGAQPDLTAGLHMAEAVVAVALSLLDPAYVPPREVQSQVEAELALVRGHTTRTESRLLEEDLDYTAFTPRGALAVDDVLGAGPFLAAEWLAEARMDFGAGEGTGRVDMGGARARTRGALLVARLVMNGSDAESAARDALVELDRVGELVFGEAAGASPAELARFAVGQGFDLHDASAIAGAATVDRIRRTAAAKLGSMEIVPLRRSADAAIWSRDRVSASPRAQDIALWLASAAWRGEAAPARHGSFHASALDALSTWLAPSLADPVQGVSSAEQERKLDGTLAVWAVLRHGTVPYARVRAHRPPADAPPRCPTTNAMVLVERHPEAIASLLGYVSQVRAGLSALHALPADAPSEEPLRDIADLLERALTTAEAEAGAASIKTVDRQGAADLPRLLASIEARIAPAGGPFAAIVYRDLDSKVLEEAVRGLDPLLLVIPDPQTGRPLLAAGAALAHVETWIPGSALATDDEVRVR
jgi:hypothetical protein